MVTLLRFAVLMLIIFALIMMVSILTPHIARFIDSIFNKDKSQLREVTKKRVESDFIDAEFTDVTTTQNTKDNKEI